ncbi:MAG: hypothetical protein J1E02_06715 [Coprobacter sp.]|nr:hypothetical protein [Coprobacter sp.]
MDKNENRPIHIDHKMRYRDEYNQYTVYLVHHRKPWWLLLLLLPLLLLIQCRKDITVHCTDAEYGNPVPDQEVALDYTAHYLWKKTFLAHEPVSMTQKTDTDGKTTFKDLPCSVYSYLFHCLAKARFNATGECYAARNVECNFHYTRNVRLKMDPRREDLHIRLVDLETSDLLPEGILTYRYIENGEEKTDSVQADAAGIATLPQMRFCGQIEQLLGSCYGYADTTRTQIPCRDLLIANDSNAMRLRPIKERFTFFVKNRETRQPVPDALCTVTLTHPGASKDTQSRQVRTSIDGKGIAFYEDAFVLSTIAIHATKQHYRDGDLEGGPWTVENFIKQPDSIRTVWLEPDPYQQEFINVDSITGKPIPGVKNQIIITDPDGTTRTVTEISNSNGIFPVTAKEDARIEIISTKEPEYRTKKTQYPLFKEIKDRKIRMQPVLETLQFRTVREEKPGVLLPNCTLQITGSISGALSPTNSGNGTFSVQMRKNEKISIVASRKGYTTNSTKVKDRDWPYLQADQERRDIPLKINLPPCNGGMNIVKQSNEKFHTRSYGMGQEEGNATIHGDFYSVDDYLTVYDGPDTSGRILVGPDKLIGNKFSIPFHFTQGAVTVVIRASTDTSSWEYEVTCPQ